jgi:hypothetical protein
MRSKGDRHRDAESDLAFRLGAAALGLLGGGALGFLVALVLSASKSADVLFPLLVFGGAALGAAVGYVRGSAGFDLAEGAVNLSFGFVVGIAMRLINPLPESPQWARLLYWCGVALGVYFLVVALYG